MAEPFLAQISIVAFNFAPRGFAFCDGQILPINQNQSLYSLLGTNYGGDGRTSFALPDIRGRTPIHRGDFHALAQKGGLESVTLTQAEMPTHKHAFMASNQFGDQGSPSSHYLADFQPVREYTTTNTNGLEAGNSAMIGHVGGSQGHNNMQPFTTIGYVIALQGLFPSRN